MNSETTHFVKRAAESLPDCWSSMEGGKKRRLAVDQIRLLERNFNADEKLEHARKVQIAEEIGLQPRQVAVWFQNRRARSKIKKVENDYDSMNAEYDQLKNDFDTLLKLNQELKVEVDQLREEWAASEKMKNPSEAVVEVEAMDSSVTNTKIIGNLEGSRSTSSKSDAFYSEIPTREISQSHSNNFFQEVLGDELIDSFNIISNNPVDQDQSFWFWSSFIYNSH